MKTTPSVVPLLAALSLAVLPVKAATYTGSGVATGTTADGNAFSSVVINNDASSISFTINSTAPMASYIFYSIELQHIGQAGSGYMGFANPWGPSVGISSGENAMINTYGTGSTPLVYSGGSWVAGSGANYTAGGTGSTFASMTFPLSSLGLSAGDSFYFDVISTYTSMPNGFGQAAYGALNNTGYPSESDNLYQPWNPNGYASYYDSATATGSTFGTAATLYTVQVVPEPTVGALLGLGALFMVRRARSQNAR